MLILPLLWYLVAWDPMRENFRMDQVAYPAIIEGTRVRPRHETFDNGIVSLLYAWRMGHRLNWVRN